MKTTEDLFLDETFFDLESEKNILNDTSIYYKGLFGMILCILPGAIIGLILIKMSLEQAKKARIEYELNSKKYYLSSIRKVKKGQTFARIGLFIFIVEIIILLIIMS